MNIKEKRAVDNVKANPRYFFSYAKKFSKLRSNIGPLRDSSTGKLVHDPKEMANILQEQYKSVFSDPASKHTRNTAEDVVESPNTTIDDIDFSVDDIIEAIDDIDPYAATSDGDIPARIIKGCKQALAPLLMKIWSFSFNKSVIPPCNSQEG